jgi:hypothetical protein
MFKPAFLDIEVYRDWFLCAILLPNGKILNFEMYPGITLDAANLTKVLKQYRVVGFNSTNYDLPLTAFAIGGATCAQIKQASDKIIVEKMWSWDLGLKPFPCEHIDLMKLAPGTASLKLYGARIHAPRLQDLPFDPSASVTPEMRETLTKYCANDLYLTKQLYEELQPAIQLREEMSRMTGLNLISAADQKIAEKLIQKELQRKV